jgi:hypothetical protein
LPERGGCNFFVARLLDQTTANTRPKNHPLFQPLPKQAMGDLQAWRHTAGNRCGARTEIRGMQQLNVTQSLFGQSSDKAVRGFTGLTI